MLFGAEKSPENAVFVKVAQKNIKKFSHFLNDIFGKFLHPY